MANVYTGPVFIVGSPRSGTTLLQYMLRSHPAISLPTGESHFMVPLYKNSQQYGDLNEKNNIRKVLQEMYRRSADFLDTDLHGMKYDIDKLTEEFYTMKCNTMVKIFSALFRKNADGENKKRWGDKTPYYVLHIPLILEMFPDAQIIHVIRDGRDCALSMFQRKYDFDVYNTYHAAKYWQQYVDTGQEYGQKLGSNQYLEIRYEDLLQDQIKTIKSVCKFLNEEYNESVINFKKASVQGKTPLLQQAVNMDNFGKWRKNMSARQIRIFESAAGDTLKRNNYKVDTNCKKLPLLVRILFRLHNRIITWFNRQFINPRYH